MDDVVTPIDPEKFRQLLIDSGYDSHKTEELFHGFQKGFDIGYRGPTLRKNFARNIPFTVGNRTEMWNKIMKEVQLGRYAGPFDKIPFENFVQSPIGLVPKKGGKTRLIFHLPYDFGEDEKSINACMPEEACHVKYNNLDYSVKACLQLMGNSSTENPTIYFCKSDIMSAFRIVPILPEQRYLLCMYVIHPLTNKIQFL